MSESDILLRDIAATCSSDCMSDLSVEMDIELLVQRSQALLDHYGSQVHTISHLSHSLNRSKSSKFSKSKDGMTDSSECTRMASRLLYSINVIEASTSGSRTRTPSPRKMGSAGMMMNQQPVSRDDSYATLMQDDQKEDLMTTGLEDQAKHCN
ncbi:hypothetical protein BC829DRAFT_420552 [Chytridium lagenaria]|nr:hypothetical protein BC829DRAFT_420552 [Chytridium lagenaria]